MNPPNRKGNGIDKSSSGKAVSPAGERAGTTPVKKMADLRMEVDAGTYRVESRKVAGKIVRDAVREIRKRLR